MRTVVRLLRRPVASVALALAAGLALSVGGFVTVRRAEFASTRTKAQSFSADRVSAIRQQADEVLAGLMALRAFFDPLRL
jgi:CHASE1-domain containing sensor protein